MTQLPRFGTAADDREFEQLSLDFAGLESKLALRELEYATRHAELLVFEARYFSIVGIRLAQVDRLFATLAERAAKACPQDLKASSAAAEANKRAQDAEDTLRFETDKPTSTYQTSDLLKKLYREAARMVHPDLGSDDQDRERRDHAMRALNEAYERSDATAMQRVVDEFKAGSISSPIMNLAQHLDAIRVKITNVKRRLLQISKDLQTMEDSELFQLFSKANVATGRGQDLLRLMANELDDEITRLQKEAG